MTKRRMRRIAKNIKNQPRSKKLISEFLADIDEVTGKLIPENIRKMLIKGHRGYMAWSERELCDKFDKTYDQLTNSKLDIKSTSRWAENDQKEKRRKALMDKANHIYDEIFEKLFLE